MGEIASTGLGDIDGNGKKEIIAGRVGWKVWTLRNGLYAYLSPAIHYENRSSNLLLVPFVGDPGRHISLLST